MNKLDSALFNAVIDEDISGIGDAISRGANVNCRSGFRNSPIFFYPIYYLTDKSLEILDILTDSGADLNLESDDGSILYLALRIRGHISPYKDKEKNILENQKILKQKNYIIKMLLKKGANSNYNIRPKNKILPSRGGAGYSQNKSLLMRAIEDFDLEIIKLLVESGAKIESDLELSEILYFIKIVLDNKGNQFSRQQMAVIKKINIFLEKNDFCRDTKNIPKNLKEKYEKETIKHPGNL